MLIGGAGGSGFDISSMRAKMQEAMEARMQKADMDQSGGLSLEEFDELRSDSPFKSSGPMADKSSEDIFTKLDQNGDGELTKEEFPKPSESAMSDKMMSKMMALQEKFSSGLQMPSFPGQGLSQANFGGQGFSEADMISQLFDTLDSTDENEEQ